MTAPETRLALAILPAIARGRTLLIGFDPDLARAIPDAAVLQQDFGGARAHAGLPGVSFGIEPPETGYDTVAMVLPKSAERLRMLLALARSSGGPGSSIVVVGRNDTGVRAAARRMTEDVGPTEVLDYRFHCRALAATSPGPQPFDLGEWAMRFVVDAPGGPLEVVSYPGVFAHGRLDEGTAQLLGALRLTPGADVLDVGCGSGVVGAWAARLGARAHCVDSDAFAVAAAHATLATVAGARASASDVYSDVAGPYSHIVTNAPFHAGVRTTTEVARRIIAEAPRHLRPAGELWVVANRFLDYLPPLREAFASVEVVADDRRFRTYRARRS